MTKSRKQNTVDVRNRILDSSIEVLGQKELHECLTDEIARKAGIGKGTIYLYFRSKEEIYYSILLRLVDDMKKIIKDVSESSLDPIAQVMKLLKLLNDFVLTHGHILMVIKEETKPGKGKLHCRFHESFEGLLGLISGIIEKGIKEKKFRKCQPIFISSLLLSALMHAARFKVKNINIPPEMIMDIFMKGIKIN